ncbi:hypothetical protein ACH40E_02845 [Streptomyces acidicola]|uniref:hypothetical protein n=1 Tax=Streptomyces acidicola TaxID=2596892 RepID=UPI0037960A7F
MTFPETILPLQVDLSLDGSTWTNITSDVRSEGQIRITRGRSDWGQQVDYGRCSLKLSNTDGKYSPRNPESPYFGQIGRNTPLRVSVNTGSVALDLPGGLGDLAYTPDSAALDITGDIDVRFDATLTNWCLGDFPLGSGSTSLRTELIAKASPSGNNQSWGLYTQFGYLMLEWSEDGTATKRALSTAKIQPAVSGRLAVRATLDVNNGAGGYDVKFYTSDSIGGTWTQLGSTVTGAGTTSIFASAALLRIGDAINVTYDEAIGLVHAAEVRNGIGGTAVANPVFTAQTSGTTSFTDAAGCLWSLNGRAEITNRKVRFVGEVASWTPRWDTGGHDVVTEVEAAGIMRRLTQGVVPTRSPMYREFTNPARQSIVAYWPMEDGSEATEFASAFDGHPPLRPTGEITPAAFSSFAASDPLPTIGTGSMRVTVPTYTATNYMFVRFFAAVPPAGVIATQRLISFYQSGTATKWSLYVNTAGNLDLRAYDNEGTQIMATGFFAFAVNGGQKSIGIELTQSGNDISYRLFVGNIEISTINAINASFVTGTLTGRTIGVVTSFRFGEDGAMNGTAVGHLALANSNVAYASTVGALVGWDGETAAARMHRLGVEEELHAYSTAPGDERVGVQGHDTVLSLMRAAGEVDEGILSEQRGILGIRHVQRTTLYNQVPALVLGYTGDDGLVAPLDPVDDDQDVTNDVTVQRSGGASGRAVLETGSLSVQDPPNGIRLYDTSVTLGLFDDDQPSYHAGWRLRLGTVDETRFPQVTVNLAGAPQNIEAAAAVDVGSRIQITNPPAWLPPDTLDLLCQGYSEVLDQFTWTITYNCTPYGPFNVATEGDALYGRGDTEGAQLADAMTSTATTANVLTTVYPLWTTDPAEVPFAVRVAGEVMTASSISSWGADTFGRTVASGWGTADSGQPWSTSGGTATNYAVGSGYGTHVLASANTSRRAFTPFAYPDFDSYVSMTTSATATGGFLSGSITGRYIDSDNLYMARVEASTSNVLTLSVRKRVAAVETGLVTYTLLDTYTPGAYVRIRFQATGSTLRAKAWIVGNLEPGPWQITVTDTDLTTSSYIGLRSISASGNTNVNPEVRYDNFEITNPQKFTVVRSVNGVTKAQSAAADVRLAYPAYTAL